MSKKSYLWWEGAGGNKYTFSLKISLLIYLFSNRFFTWCHKNREGGNYMQIQFLYENLRKQFAAQKGGVQGACSPPPFFAPQIPDATWLIHHRIQDFLTLKTLIINDIKK